MHTYFSECLEFNFLFEIQVQGRYICCLYQYLSIGEK